MERPNQGTPKQSPREDIPRVRIEDLPREQKQSVESLESQTDKVYELRTQLASFFRKYRHPLYQAFGLDGAPKNGGLLGMLDSLERERLQGKSIDTLIALEDDSSDDQYLEYLDLISALERVLDVYKELKKTQETSRVRPDGSDATEIDRYYSMRFQELGQAMWVREEMQEDARRLEAMREKAINQGASPLVVTKIDQKIADLQTRAKNFFESRPEAWILSRGMRLKEMKEAFDARGRIVETPYVASKMRHVEAEIKSGRPVFLIGELGSGKTELARQLSYKILSAPHIAKWETLHPAPPKDSSDYRAWLARREAEREAIVVSGHRALEADALFASREVKRKETPPPEEQLQYIHVAWKQYLETPNVKSREMSASDTTHEQELFEKGYLELFRAPIETSTVLGGLLQAMKEGRPFILDEMNAVPHHILIALNDLLMRKPGDLVQIPIPGTQPIRVQAGYCFIGTGNYKPEDGKRYVGRQQMDAAFLSRFAVVSYDYLPMSENAGSQDDPEKNELYHMAAARLIDRDLSLDAPKGSLDKLKGICKVARILQNIISDQNVSSAFFANVNGAKVNPKDVLQENVLSIRHLLPIIDTWKRSGYSESLEDVLYDKYVSKSDARPQEKLYIYYLLQTVGNVFSKNEGWPDALVKPEEVITYRDTEKRLYDTDRYTNSPSRDTKPVELVHYSTKALVKELFGAAPKREEIRADFFRQKNEQVGLEQTSLLAIGEAADTSKSITKALVDTRTDVFA